MRYLNNQKTTSESLIAKANVIHFDEKFSKGLIIGKKPLNQDSHHKSEHNLFDAITTSPYKT